MSDDSYWNEIDDFDDAGLAEVTQIEQAYTQRSQQPTTVTSSIPIIPSSHTSSTLPSTSIAASNTTTRSNEAASGSNHPPGLPQAAVSQSHNSRSVIQNPEPHTRSPYKRRRDSNSSYDVQKKRKIVGNATPIPSPNQSLRPIAGPTSSSSYVANQAALDVLTMFEKEVTCCICDDIFVCPLSSNACSHTFCAPCWDSWKQSCLKSRKPFTCPNCRTEVSLRAKLHSNYTAQSIIARFLEEARCRGLDGWGIEGEKKLEWEAREREWRSTSSYVKKEAPKQVQPRGRPIMPAAPAVSTSTSGSRRTRAEVPLFLPDDDEMYQNSTDEYAWSDGEDEDEDTEEIRRINLAAPHPSMTIAIEHILARLAAQPVTIGTASTSGNRSQGSFRPGRGV
ncbi:hypothetical protein FRC02_000506 [Tulasnella sp. 418]|nr:hypothetical protein FRC02_000506 [Tulasnella sp. 418]